MRGRLSPFITPAVLLCVTALPLPAQDVPPVAHDVPPGVAADVPAAGVRDVPPLAMQSGSSARAQGVPTPESHFGFVPGTDRKLADWDELTAYYEILAETSPRVTIDTLGPTTLGRPFVMLTVTSRDNHARLDELHEIQLQLADPRLVADSAELERLLDEGRAVVLITQQIHSTEVGAGQMAPNLLHRLAASDEEKVRQILDNVILLHVPSLNPDGTDLVSEWYNRWVGTEYEAAPPPFLYHYYVGHDNNRDWYAFTQLETRLAITGAHNAWHPQIVHDVHQMGGSGARIFFPPFIEPWERNIDPRLTAAVNQLGSYMAAELTAQGKAGVVINAIYDAFTPARAYQHYHGGARILSETASARLATPVVVEPDELEGRRGYDASRSSWNFPLPWPGGEWGLPDIVEYMEAGAMALLTNAARNRRYWLENFYEINERAVDGWERWPEAWVIPAQQDNPNAAGGADADGANERTAAAAEQAAGASSNPTGLANLLWILRMGDVEVHRAERAFSAAGREFPAGSYVIPMHQPYTSFAQTMLERQEYPDLRQYEGGPPQPPYDVTAHTLPLLMDVEAVAVDQPLDAALGEIIPLPEVPYETPANLSGDDAARVALFKPWDEPMESGWTRWVLDQHDIAYDTLHAADIREGDLADRYDAILFQSQSPESILEGWSPEEMPEPFAGGLGDDGVAALRSFVEQGGRVVAIGEATDFAIQTFDLPITNIVEDLPPGEFYIPGSILRLDLDSSHPIAAGVDPETIAWFWDSSRAFDVGGSQARVVGRYGTGDPRLSGWVLGAERIADQAALVEADVGRGSVVLFGFQPNYRAQTIASWPLLFNALAGDGTRVSARQQQ